MRTRSFVLGGLCLLCILGVLFLWRHHNASPVRDRLVASPVISSRSLSTAPLILAGKTGSTKGTKNSTGLVNTNQFGYRLSNTTKPIDQLLRDDKGILLENALIDTANPLNLSIPANLRASGDPRAYIVQANGPVDKAFRAMLTQAGATIVSYIPNDAYLVRATAGVAGALGANPQTQAVIPYEPYYKVQSSLLGYSQGSLPKDAALNLGLFGDDVSATAQQIEKLGGQIFAWDRSPFGPVVQVRLPAALAANWTALARLTGVHIVEPYFKRAVANDLARVTVGVSVDTLTLTNYLNLTGSNIIVEVNDTGIDAIHPDFSLSGNAKIGAAGPTRVLGDVPESLVDTDGHGTHVAGIIAGNGAESSTFSATNLPSGSVTNADFRGKAPQAILFSVGGITGGGDTNASLQYFQEAPALTNALISNNSWGFPGDNQYDLAAASFDAAVRDALPFVTGSQPVLFVFAAGNSGSGDDNGGGGNPDTISSPATAKDVITVGATEELRNITNQVTALDGSSSAVWQPMTDTSFQVASYSSRGNVGIGIEGQFGRYKPDVVAPGSFVVSTRSEQWDTNAYYNPTNFNLTAFADIADPGSANFYSLLIPPNIVGIDIQLEPNLASPTPFPDLPITLWNGTSPRTSPAYVTGAGFLTLPPPPITPVKTTWQYSISNNTSSSVAYDTFVDLITTNDNGNYLQVLQGLNESLGSSPHYYRYETGTSMATPSVSGVLALMQEFYANAYGARPSPAMLKALLINGARTTDNYDFNVQNAMNFQGWGMINLPAALQPGITNQLDTSCSVYVQDQNPTNALATGDSQTFFISITNAQAQQQPLRITVAWTDPPGNPAAAIKLVNDLVLVVTNLSTNKVYYGNNIGSGNTFTSSQNTNTPPNFDLINNVQNVYIAPPLAASYSVTITGYRVNVNAVTAQANNVVQDFALAISSGDGTVTNAMTVAATPPSFISNPTGDQQVNYLSSTNNNGPLLNQFVGANTPLLGTNTIPFTATAPEGFGPNNWQVTTGMTNQWHFYVITNTFAVTNAAFTNAAFVTFIPDTLSIPRMGVFAPTTANATRPQADIDLYVSTDPSLTNLNPVAISNAVVGTQIGMTVGGVFNGASLSRLGTEFVVDIGSQGNEVYYVGVKSEDQMASEYGFFSIFSATPFSQMNPNGTESVFCKPVPMTIPDGSPALPGFAYVVGLAIQDMTLDRVVVTNQVWHRNFGDLIGTLNHDTTTIVLNNHDSIGDSFFTTFAYDDTPYSGVPSDGPGSLTGFVGQQGIGAWIMSQEDNSLTQTGLIQSSTITLTPHMNPTQGINASVPAQGWFYTFVDVPPGATNLTVAVINNTVTPDTLNPLQLYVQFGTFPTLTNFDATTVINNGSPPSGSVSIGPPLTSGRYFIGIFNPSLSPAQFFLIARIGLPFVPAQTIYNSADAPIPILDDAITTDSIHVPDDQIISSLDVAISVQHPRISDLVFHLISPDGTRSLLMENRGALDPNGAGGVATITTNTVLTSDFDTVPAGDYSGGPVGPWLVTANQVSVQTDPVNTPPASNLTNLLALANGTLSTFLNTVPGQTYTLTFACRGPGIAAWWRGESNTVDSINGNNGTISGGVGYTNGEVGSAFQLDGSTGFISVQPSPSLNIGAGSGVTIEGWINPSSLGPLAIPVVEWDASASGPDGMQFWISNPSTSPGNLYANIKDTGGNDHQLLSNQGLVSIGAFQHVALTYDTNSGAASFYLNGNQVATANLGTFIPQTTYALYFGKRTFSATELYGGLLDEMSLYNRALSASEIKAIASDTNGKFNTNQFLIAPRQSLAEAQISVNGNVVSNFFGRLGWLTKSISFTATQTSTPLQIQGLEPGMLLDNMSVVSVQTNYNYLVFTEDTNKTTTPIKFAVPPFSESGTNIVVWQNGFEEYIPNGSGFPNLFTAGGPDQYFSGGWLVDNGSIEVLGLPSQQPYRGNYFMDLDGFAAGTISTNIPTVPGQTYTLNFAYARNPDSIGVGITPQAAFFINGVPSATVTANQTGVTWTDLQWRPTSFSFTATSSSTALMIQSRDPVGSATGVLLDAFQLTTPASGIYYLPEESLDTFHGLDALGTWTLEIQDDRVGATNPAPLLLNWQLRFNYVTTGTNSAGVPPGTTATNVIPADGWTYYPVNVPSSADWATNILVFATGPLDMWFNPTNNPVAGPSDSELLAASTGGSSTFSLTSSPTNIVPGTTYFIGLHNTNVFAVTNGFQVDFHFLPPPISLTNGVPITNVIPARVAFNLSGHSFVDYTVTVPPDADYVTNTLISASLPVNLWFNQNVAPNGTNPPNYQLLSNSTGGVFVLSAGSIPQLAPGFTYHLAIQNTNGVPVTIVLQVDFHFRNPITGPGITVTNVNGTNGFLVRWSGPTNYQYTIQWKTNLAPAFPWNTVSNPVINVSFVPPNGNYSWFDDGSLTGGWSPQKFYQIVASLLSAPITNSTPASNIVVAGSIMPLTVAVPINAIAATNVLVSASGPLNVYFNQSTPPTGNTNAGDVLMLSTSTGGTFVLSGSSVPPLVPGANYYLGLQNPGGSTVSFVFQVNFALSAAPPTNPPSFSGITVTNVNGTNAILLKWVAPTNYQFQIQWATSLAPAVAWHTISNVVLTWSGVVSPTNNAYGFFQFLDDGSLTGGLGPWKFYRLIEYPYSTPIPQTLTIVNTAIVGNAVQFQWVAPTNYQYQVLWTTNLGLPLVSWSVLPNPVLGLSNGVYTFTDTNQTGPATNPKFFRVLEH